VTSGDLGLSQADPDAFLVESARLDPPVTSVSAIAPKGGQQLQGPGGGQLRVAQGVPMQLLLSHANRDPAVFERPYAFDPSRRNLDKVLSWNGVDAAVRAGQAPCGCPACCHHLPRLLPPAQSATCPRRVPQAPRGCPGRALSIDLARQIVEQSLPPRDAPPAAPRARAAQWQVEAAVRPSPGQGSCDYSASDRPSEDLELRNEHDDEVPHAC